MMPMPLAGHYIIAAGVTTDPSLPKVQDDLRLVLQYFVRELGDVRALPELIGEPTVEQFRTSLSNWFASDERRPEDQIVLYFSGHGELSKNLRHYLLLAGSD